MPEHSSPEVVLRKATTRDRSTMWALVRRARLNPLGLDWRPFVIAEEAGQVIGIGQIKPHRDGSRELASLVVLRDRRGQGVGSLLIRSLLADQPPPLYLMCDSPLEAYYTRFGFRRLQHTEMPRYFRRMLVAARVAEPIMRLFVPGGVHIIAMVREDNAHAGGAR